jgi:hypothetical protein
MRVQFIRAKRGEPSLPSAKVVIRGSKLVVKRPKKKEKINKNKTPLAVSAFYKTLFCLVLIPRDKSFFKTFAAQGWLRPRIYIRGTSTV